MGSEEEEAKKGNFTGQREMSPSNHNFNASSSDHLGM